MKPWRLGELNLKFVRSRDWQVAVLPIGATEPHNLHLPYATDNYQVEAICDRACELATAQGGSVVLLPTIPYGSDSNQMPFPLCMDVKPSTLNAIVTDLVRSCEHHGVVKFVIVNGHGGNEFKPLLRELYGLTRVFIALVNWWTVLSDVQSEIFEHPGEHADEMETSLVLHLRPDLVNVADADEGAVKPFRLEALNKGWAGITRPWERLTTNSGYGNPHEATAEKGTRALELVADRLARFFKELSDSPLDETFPF